MKIIIKGGHVLDPANDIDGIFDILIEDGLISRIDSSIDESDAEIIQACDMLVIPGLVDIHTHMRDPGQEYKEDLISGTRAAVAGGVTSLACMPNTSPVNDNQAVTRFIIEKAKSQGVANVFPVGAISHGMDGEILSEMGDLKSAGCVAFSDDGKPVKSSELMRRALEYADTFDMPIISHAEDLSLVGEGCMNDGVVATELGLKGIPWVAEDAATAREIMLAEFTGARLHIAHVSTRGSVELVRQAKARGARVTCEVSPHHFTLSEEAVRGYNTNAKMNPPLRTQEDIEAIKEGLKDGTIDAIATDHAPHHIDEKNVEFPIALNGMIGLETLLPLTLQLVRDKDISLKQAVAMMTCQPAAIIGIDRGTLGIGRPADITIVDPERDWTVFAEDLFSKSKNTPFIGCRLKGVAARTLVAGKTVFERK